MKNEINVDLNSLVEVFLVVEIMLIACEKTVFHEKDCQRLKDESIKCTCNRDFFPDSLVQLRRAVEKLQGPSFNFKVSTTISSILEMINRIEVSGEPLTPEILFKITDFNVKKFLKN